MSHSKCYRGLTALFENFELEVGKKASFEGKLHVFCNINSQLYVMVCHSNSGVRYAPLYIHSFPFLRPHFLAEAEKVNIGSDDPANITTLADKLRYYRHRNRLLQREVADYVGIERTTYSAYEEDGRDYYPYDTLQRIAEFLKVKVTDLLDDYNTFLCEGQARQIKALRDEMSMSQAELAAHFNVSKEQIKKWEQGKSRMTKKFWEKVFGRRNI